MKKFVFFVIYVCCILGSVSCPALVFKNFPEIEKALNTRSVSNFPEKKRVKIAILDKGFFGYEKEIGRGLPQDTHFFPGPVESPTSLKNNHGLVMAQMVTKLSINPDLYLYNAFGYSNIKWAIEDLITQKVDLVLYAEVWEFGGNGDGRGFINALVDQALDKGVTWINAAGNFETKSFSGPIRTLKEDWVALPDQNQSLKILCEGKEGEKCLVRIVLSWNDFKDDPTLGTDKDLDLALVDDFLNIIESSSLKQTADAGEKRPGYSSYSRETVSVEIKPGTYFIRVKNRSLNFNSGDQMTLTVDGDRVTVPSYTKSNSILNPADNERVITVGALDSDRSSHSLRLDKPNLLTMSSVKTSEGEFRGSSNSAAFVVGSLALVHSRFPHKSFKDILFESSLSGWSDNQKGLPLDWLQFSPPEGHCFAARSTKGVPEQILDIINLGGVFVRTTKGARIMTPFDPLLLEKGLVRQAGNDLVLTTPHGFEMGQRGINNIPKNWIEVFQTPEDSMLCESTLQSLGKIFRLKSY